ncbi:MAG: hypothetical protein ACXWV0_01240 [Flavisolibacter sp.]
MSITDFPIPEKKSDQISIDPNAMLSLNQVLRESMQSLYDNPALVIRCEELPSILGQYDEILRMFKMLLELITNEPPAGPKLFLYVDCDQGVVEPGLEEGFQTYIIKFYTNITTGDTWREKNKNILSGCETIVSGHKGTFQANNISYTGCLFAITLAGKFA